MSYTVFRIAITMAILDKSFRLYAKG